MSPTTDRERASAALDRIGDLDRQISRLQARQLREFAEFGRYGGSARSVIAEAAMEIKATETQTSRRLALANALTTRLPCTLAAMDRGDINEYKASIIAGPTMVLDDDKAREVDALMASRIEGKFPRGLHDATMRAIKKIDPDGYNQRAQKARKERKVSLVHQDHGMSTLFADLPTEQACAIKASLDAAAKALRKTDKTRTLDELRADILAERLLAAANGDSHIRAQIYVYVDLLTLIGLNDNPAQIPGYGTVPAWLARQIATSPNSTWTRIITDPDTGQLLSVGRKSYRPPADLDAYIRVRARTCETPGCNRPAHFGDIDHTTEWQHGGETDERELRGKCKHHHLLKDEPGWIYTAGPDGSTIITTSTGRVHTYRPEPFHEPRTHADEPAPF